jgi:hypothetical protein
MVFAMRRVVSPAAFLFSVCAMLMASGQASLHVGAQIAPPPNQVGPQAVWNPSDQVIANIRAKCGADSANVGECFLREMRSAGASAEAVAFSKTLVAEGFGYLSALRDTGRVSIAYVEYVFRANEMEGIFLVNGDPPLIDVDDAKYISQSELRKNSDYAALLQQYPQLSIWPAGRNNTKFPLVTSSTAGQQFVVEYLLQNGCHACARLGTAVISFQFDQSGRFRETRVLSIHAIAAAHQASAARQTRTDNPDSRW